MNDIMSWPVFFATLALSGMLVFSRQKHHTRIIAALNATAAFWLAGQQAIVMLAVMEVLFQIMSRPKLKAGTALGVLFGISPFLTLLIVDSGAATARQSAVFAFFSLQAVGGFLNIWMAPTRPTLNRLEWYAFGLFFPTLLTGPIWRWTRFLEQLQNRPAFHIERGVESLRWFMRGVFKRAIFASTFYAVIDNSLTLKLLTNLPLLLMFAIALRYALWADISGYTDWARGAALLIGFDVPTNFRQPFHTVSVVEFWRRWHITLTSWVKDYVYYPIVSLQILRRRSQWIAVTIGVLVAFLSLSLWHGLSLGLFAMGLIKGFGLLLSFLILNRWPRLYKVVSPVLLLMFVILPTPLLRMDWSTFISSLTQMPSPANSVWNPVGNAIAVLNSNPYDSNTIIYWILGAALLWQIYEGLESPQSRSKSKRPPALVEALLLFVVILLLKTQHENVRFLYAPTGR